MSYAPKYLLFDIETLQAWPHLFVSVAAAKSRRTKTRHPGFIYEVELIDVGPYLKRLYV